VSLASVQADLAVRAPDLLVLVTEARTATVAEAAAVHGVEPAQIAKTLGVRLGGEVALVVLAGDARLDNRKFKDRFAAKPKMLGSDEVLAATGHPVGGVCPFGLPGPLRVYADVSLQRFAEVVPAAGAPNAAVRIAPDRLAALAGAAWVDVAELPPAG
jgi:prolyl-tRNA editing enzyme YbaK/EbsC (Cys-tRNA(Pro) deacylase)